jgi:hypothetical protein
MSAETFSDAYRTPTHQTVRLGRGRHAGPGPEVCVMELASMLAGDPFSDHPATACPLIGSLLRTYNDAVEDDRRQLLYPLASLAVGTRGDRAITERRSRALAEWCEEHDALLPRWRRWTRRLSPQPCARTLIDQSMLAIRCLPRRSPDRAHEEFVKLIERLAHIGREPDAGRHTRSPAPAAQELPACGSAA